MFGAARCASEAIFAFGISRPLENAVKIENAASISGLINLLPEEGAADAEAANIFVTRYVRIAYLSSKYQNCFA